MKILNLILYSRDECYDMMADALTAYLRAGNIEHYFYSYEPGLLEEYSLEDNHLYIKGTETFLPGILDKTLDAFRFFQGYKYDYIVRSNVSTIIDFGELVKYIQPGQYDYAGPLYYPACIVDVKSGTTVEKHAIYHSHHFVSGICVILSRKAVGMLARDTVTVQSYGVIDDLAMGWYFHDRLPEVVRSRICEDGKVLFNSLHRVDGVVVYRNRTESRSVDVCRMNTITGELLACDR